MTLHKLSPLEHELVKSLINSQQEHERRLATLEELLQQFGARSTEDSASAQEAFNKFSALAEQLCQLSADMKDVDKKFSEFEAVLAKWAPIWSNLDSLLKAYQQDTKAKTEAYQLMEKQYNNLASEVAQLRNWASESERLRKLDEG